MFAERVPVRINNNVIGSATVFSDGTLELTVTQPSDQVKVLLEGIQAGMCSGLSITAEAVLADEAFSWGGIRTPREAPHAMAAHNID